MGEPRVIKFRVWVIGGKAQEPYMETFTLQEMFEDKINSWWVERNKLRIMQFTGLTDRQGKEIYESDLVEYDSGNEDSQIIKEEVRFEGGAFYPVCTQPSETFTVVGNKYEA